MNSVRTGEEAYPRDVRPSFDGGASSDKAARHARFLELLKPHQASLSRFARAMTGDPESAKDLVSETILKAYESFEKLKDADRFRSYLFTIAARLNIRERSRQRRWSDWDEDRMNAMPAEGSDPAIRIEVELLYRALQQLPEKQREAIVLFEISGLSLEEIKDIQGGSLSGVKSRIVRGREALADLLGVAAERDQNRPISARTGAQQINTNRPLLAVAAEVKR